MISAVIAIRTVIICATTILTVLRNTFVKKNMFYSIVDFTDQVMTAVLAVLMAGQVADLIFTITGPLGITLSLQNTQLTNKMYYDVYWYWYWYCLFPNKVHTL